MRLIIVRHGQPEGEREFRFTGQSDVRLSFRGKRQARLIGDLLSEIKLDAIYCSDLARAIETAQICAHRAHLSVQPRTEFREIDVGSWTGLSWQQVEQIFPTDLLAWQSDRVNYSRGGGESYKDLEHRVITGLWSIYDQHPAGSIALICHSGTIRSLLSGLKLYTIELALELLIEHGSLTVLDINRPYAQVECINDTRHLVSDKDFFDRNNRIHTSILE